MACHDARELFNQVNTANGSCVVQVPLERARGPVIDDGPDVPTRLAPSLLRRARDASLRLVHDEIGTFEGILCIILQKLQALAY